MASNRSARSSFLVACISSIEMANLAGVSLRQLQWWDERGIVSVGYEGHRRFYEKFDAMQCVLLAELRRLAVPLKSAKTIIRGALKSNAKAVGYLVVRRKSFSVVPTATAALALASKPGPCNVIDLEKILLRAEELFYTLNEINLQKQEWRRNPKAEGRGANGTNTKTVNEPW